jgi:hypothetical protein
LAVNAFEQIVVHDLFLRIFSKEVKDIVIRPKLIIFRQFQWAILREFCPPANPGRFTSRRPWLCARSRRALPLSLC